MSTGNHDEDHKKNNQKINFTNDYRDCDAFHKANKKTTEVKRIITVSAKKYMLKKRRDLALFLN